MIGRAYEEKIIIHIINNTDTADGRDDCVLSLAR